MMTSNMEDGFNYCGIEYTVGKCEEADLSGKTYLLYMLAKKQCKVDDTSS